jgi:hypothetical protein
MVLLLRCFLLFYLGAGTLYSRTEAFREMIFPVAVPAIDFLIAQGP